MFLRSSPGVLAQKGTEHSLGGHGSPGSRPVADRYESSAALSLALCVSQGSSRDSERSTTRPAHHTSSRLLTRVQLGADKEPCLYPGARCWVSQPHLSQTPLNAAQTTTSSLQERPDTPPMFYLSAVMALRGGGRGSRTSLFCTDTARTLWLCLGNSLLGTSMNSQVLPVLSFPGPCPRSGLSSRPPTSSGAQFLVPSPLPFPLLRQNTGRAANYSPYEHGQSWAVLSTSFYDLMLQKLLLLEET